MESENEFFVESVLSKKVNGNKITYLVKWYNFDEISWEPVENLTCTELIEKFEEKLQATVDDTRKIEKIVAAYKVGKELKYVVKLAGSKVCEDISASEAFMKYYDKIQHLNDSFFEL